MLGKPTTDPTCRQGVANVEGQHDILHNESFAQYEAFQSESKFVSDKNILILNDYETDRTSKRNFYLIANNIPDNQLGEVESRRVNEKSESSIISTLEKPESVKLDTVRSGESLIKHFNFDTSKYNNDTNKCIAFWRTLKQTDLQPVKCTLLKGGRSSMTSKQCNEEGDETNDEDSCMWYKALIELQKRKMDEAAFAAISKQCKLCGQEEPYSKFKKKQGERYSESELKDCEDITCLNYWNPDKKQIVVKKSTNKEQQHKSLEVLPTVTAKQKLEVASHTIEDRIRTNEDNTSISEKRYETDAHQQFTIKLPHFDPCKCGRTQCFCNACDEASREVETVSLSLFESQEKNTTFSMEDSKDKISAKHTSGEPKENNTADKKNLLVENDTTDNTDTENLFSENHSKRILPKCAICKTYCKCWEHKIEMSKQFINKSKYQLEYQETKQDKSCETKNEVEETTKEQKKFCIICGHNDCNCNGPPHTQPHKYFQYIEFDDNIITSLLIKKDRSLCEVKTLTNAEKISKSTFQKNIYEHSKEDVCCTKERDKMPCSNQEKIKTIDKVISTKQVPQKKLLITPEQRAKDITNRNRVMLELDKYGIPQLVRYADGRLAPKPTTSQDILTLNSDHADG